MSEKVVLCNGEEMLERLLRLSDCQIFRSLLYPKWLTQAGKELDVEVAVRMILLAVSDFEKSNVTPDEVFLIQCLRDNFIGALFATPEDWVKVLKVIPD